MSVVNMAKNIKQVHQDSVICYKVGTFYQCFGKDAYIIAYFFGYKMKMTKDIMECGFPTRILSKVIAKLEQNKIDYLILNPRNNYEVDYKLENGNLNKYDKTFENAYSYMKISNRIDRINESLKLEINSKEIKEKIRKIEEIINEGWKI